MQYDLLASNVNGSRDTIGVADGFVDSTQHHTGGYSFYLTQDGLGGKIYVGSYLGYRFFSTIDNPNGKGDSCDFKLRGVQLTKWIDLTVPSFPNYHLGRIPGSACDTLHNDIKPIYTQVPWLKVFPNPANDDMQFDYNWIEWEKSAECRLLIADLSGRVVMEVSIPRYSTRQSFSVKGLATGTYMVSLTSKSPFRERDETKGDLNSQIQVLATCKLVKQ